MHRLLVSVTILAAAGTPAAAQEARPSMTLDTARAIVSTCVQHASDNDQRIAIAVFDQHGNLRAFARMDSASVGAAEAAMWKGKSAAKFGFATAATANWGGGPAGIATWRGGLPIHLESGELIGGVGVSGAPSEFDEECGNAGIAAAGLPLAEIVE